MWNQLKVTYCVLIYFYFLFLLVFSFYHLVYLKNVSLDNKKKSIGNFFSLDNHGFCLFAFISYNFLYPVFYFNKPFGTWLDLILCFFYWSNKLFDFLLLLFFFWEYFLALLLTSVLVVILIFLYIFIYFPALFIIFCFFKFFYLFVQIFNSSLVFDFLVKIKIVYYCLLFVVSLFIRFWPNFDDIADLIYQEILFYSIHLWADFVKFS